MYSLKNLPLHLKAIIIECDCSERFGVFGIRVGNEIELLGECIFGGTVMVKCQDCVFCMRRTEFNMILEGKLI